MTDELLVSPEIIENQIYLIRGQRVMLDRDLAMLYQVETRRLNEQVKRNIESFPSDFMFSLTRGEIFRISQNAISSEIKYSSKVYAFTEYGILMLSSILKSSRARQVNIQIMRSFVKLKQVIFGNYEVLGKLDKLENQIARLHAENDSQNEEIQTIFNIIKKLLEPPNEPVKKIGFI